MRNLITLFCWLLVLPFSIAVAQSSPQRVTLTNIAYYSEQNATKADDIAAHNAGLICAIPLIAKDSPRWCGSTAAACSTDAAIHRTEDPRLRLQPWATVFRPRLSIPVIWRTRPQLPLGFVQHRAVWRRQQQSFCPGHSAGGYLSAMIGMDARWLRPHGFSNLQLAGIAPISGQVTTHFHVKKLLGDSGPELRPLIDEFAPLYHSAGNLPPICLILGDRALEYKNRVEENALLAVSLKNLGHPHVEFYEMGGLDHGTVGEGGLIPLRYPVAAHRNNADSPPTTSQNPSALANPLIESFGTLDGPASGMCFSCRAARCVVSIAIIPMHAANRAAPS